MKCTNLTLCMMLCTAWGSDAHAADDLLKCNLLDGAGKSDSITFVMYANVTGNSGPQGPELYERLREIVEPPAWTCYWYKYVRNDDLGIVAATDYHSGDDKVFGGAAYFYYDKRSAPPN